MDTKQRETEAERLAREARLGVAFEELIFASAVGAAACAGLWMVWRHLELALAGAWNPIDLLLLLGRGFVVGGVVFLAAFASAIAIGAPLFRLLERLERHTILPFYGTAAAIGVAVGAALQGFTPGAADLAFAALPGIIIVRIFEARIRPVWRAAEQHSVGRSATHH